MSAGGSDMPGGGCITAGEVRPGRGGGWGGSAEAYLLEGRCSRCSSQQLARAWDPTWRGRSATFLLQKRGCGAPRIRRGRIIRHLRCFSRAWRRNQGAGWAPSYPLPPDTGPSVAPAGVPCSWPRVTFIRPPTQISSLGVGRADPSAAQTQLPPGPGDAPPQPRATILQPPETPASGVTHTFVWERGQGRGLVKGAEPSSLGTSSRVSQGEAAWVLATPTLREHQADLHARACLWRAGRHCTSDPRYSEETGS